MSNRERLSELRASLGFTVEQYPDDKWAIVLEDMPWSVFDAQPDAVKECNLLNEWFARHYGNPAASEEQKPVDPDGCEHGTPWHENCPQCFFYK